MLADINLQPIGECPPDRFSTAPATPGAKICNSIVTLSALLLTALPLLGCGESSADSWSSIAPASEQLVEAMVEEYVISVPFVQRDESGETWRENVQLRFLLAALVDPRQLDAFEQRMSERHGRFNDEVIHVCRNLDVNDLRDPGNHFLGIALMEAADSVLGRETVRRFVVSDFGIELQ